MPIPKFFEEVRDAREKSGEVYILKLIQNRMHHLKPFVREYKRLEMADKGLENIDKNWSK